MADAVVQLVARFNAVTGLTEDRVENVIHCAVDSATYLTDIAAAVTGFRDFYIVDAGPASHPLGYYMSPSINRNANQAQILAYYTPDLTGGTPFGSPIVTLDFTLTAAGSASPYPNEVAVVMSVAGDTSGVPISEPNPTPPPATIRPAQRRRGRLFFGPLNLTAGAFSGGILRPATSFITDITLAADQLAADINAGVDYAWGVWSKADATVWPIVTGYVDDAWDTQRRRGLGPSQRVLFTV